MKSRGIVVPLGKVANSVDEAVQAVKPLIEESGNNVVVLKAQIHAGGRGKGRFKEYPDVGGVNVVLDGNNGGIPAAESKVRELAQKMLGSTLVTVQTGLEGKQVNRLYLEQGIDIEREVYLSIVLDRTVSRYIVMAHGEGGTEIEKIPQEAFLRAEIDPAIGLANFQAAELAFGLGFEGKVLKNGTKFIKTLSKVATELDSDLVEINPLVVSKQGEVIALDGKMSFDTNALYRHPEIVSMRDRSEGKRSGTRG